MHIKKIIVSLFLLLLAIPAQAAATTTVKATSPDGFLSITGVVNTVSLGKEQPDKVITVEQLPWKGHDYMYALLQHSPTEYYYRVTAKKPLFAKKASLVTIQFPSTNSKDGKSDPQWRVYRRNSYKVGWNIVRKGYRIKGDKQEVDAKFDNSVEFIVINEAKLKPSDSKAVYGPAVLAASLGQAADGRPVDFTYLISEAEAKKGTTIAIKDLFGGNGSLEVPAGSLSGEVEIQIEASTTSDYLLTGTVRIKTETVKIKKPLVFWWGKKEPFMYEAFTSQGGVWQKQDGAIITGTAVGIPLSEAVTAFAITGKEQTFVQQSSSGPLSFSFPANSNTDKIIVTVVSYDQSRALSPVFSYMVFPKEGTVLDPALLPDSELTIFYQSSPYRIPVVAWYNEDGTSKHMEIIKQSATSATVSLPAWYGKIGVEYDPQTYQGAASWYPTNLTRRAPLGAAANVYPLNSWVTVTNIANSKSVTVKVVSVGPYADGRIIDLTGKAFQYLERTVKGTIKQVIVRPAKAEEIKKAEKSLLPAKKKK
ncbi:MAG: RlpA-like double-psi beta-barrel domain-containing protein [bacterium]